MDIKIAEGIASTLHKVDAEALREALNLSADDQTVEEKKFFDWLTEKQGKVIKEREDRGYSRAQKSILTNLEKDLRSEFEIEEADLKGVDLIKHIVERREAEAAKAAGAKGKLTDEDIKKHPLYLNLEKGIEKVKTEYEEKIKAANEQRSYDQLLQRIDQEAEKIFNSLGEAILPEDATIASKHKQRLLYDELRAFKYQLNGEDILPLKPDGSRVEDKAGNAKTLKDLVTEIAKQNFQFKAGKDRRAPGNGGDDKGGSGGDKKYTGPAPKDAKGYVQLLMDPSLTVEMKAEIKKEYGPSFSNN